MISRVLAGRYELLEKLGEGSIFVAYRARDHETNTLVTVKLLQPAFADDTTLVHMLKQCLSSTSSLNHPRIARILHVGEHDGQLVLVTEFVRGISLKERIRRVAPFTLSVAVDIALAVAEGLESAHRAGIAHGDLRPHNIIVSQEGLIKVTDFGLLPALLGSPLAQASWLTRAAPYLPPELTEIRSATPAADVYALGVILFEMVTGGVPFPADTPVAIALRHAKDPPPSPRAVNPGVPRAVEGIVLKAMQKLPDQRYPDMSAMVQDLRAVHDALRFGKPLSWSPLERAPEGTASAPRVREARPAEAEDAELRFIKYAFRALTVLAALVVIAFVVVGFWLTRPVKEAPVPDLRGKALVEARRLTQDAGLNLVIRQEDYNEQFPAGTVYLVQPEPGARLKVGGTVQVWVSKGSRTVEVPNVQGLSEADARKRLIDAGLQVGKVEEKPHPTAPAGTVLAQSPAPQQRVNRDAPVDLTVSKGLPLPSVPDEGVERGFELVIPVKGAPNEVVQVRLEVQDGLGVYTILDEPHYGGEKLIVPVRVRGRNVVFRIYFNNQLVHEEVRS
ncbi:MAG: protein kinase [Armatimonadota bacterium]|nr:protein kinase [bacterium]MDW8319993.1 protein kinase [Armatimonadota bacterium]